MKTRWDTFKDFICTKEIGYIFTRKELLKSLHDEPNLKEPWSGIPASTIYICVGHMFRGGFMKSVGRGKYQLLMHPPKEFATSDSWLIAKGDNLTYIERLHKRKERQKINKEK